MKLLATTALAGALAWAAFAGGSGAFAAEDAQRRDPQAQAQVPAPKTPAEIRDELYARLAASNDADETEGLVGLLFASYGRSGSDTGDLLIERARTAIAAQDYDAAGQILDAAVAFMPDRAEAWNARATLRYLDDDYDGSMADIAETLKRDPRHLGALMGMASILESRDKKQEALEVYERAQALAPHWKNAEEAAGKLKAEIAGQEL
jgi:tetratricopeptide (TPR) repeat protein